MSIQKVQQQTEIKFKVNITIPCHLPPCFEQELLLELEHGLRNKAKEITGKWYADASLEPETTISTDNSNEE